ncbi:unnamed protein product, partial [Prorocentrum cordatum]
MAAPAAPAAAAPASAKKPKEPRPSVAAQNRRRQRIRAELQTKAVSEARSGRCSSSCWRPAHRRTSCGRPARLLEPTAYDAVVEERSVEGLCGFPPCQASAATTVPEKRWTIKSGSREVFATSEVCRFCSLACMRESGAYALRLEPDPAYVRPAAAVAAARSATAAAAGRRQCSGSPRSAEPGREGPFAPPARTAPPAEGVAAG